MGWFFNKSKSENIKNNNRITAVDKIFYMQVDNSSDDTLFDICDKILSGTPVLANFDHLNIQDSNSMLAFISGVIYATDGRSLKIQSRLFLFGRKEEFVDGTLYQYYEDLK